MIPYKNEPFEENATIISNSYSLDELDLAICEILSENCRISFRTIARKLHKAPLTIKIRIDNLLKLKIIKSWGAHLDYEKMGYDFISIVEIDIVRGKTSTTLEQITKSPQVFGVYDITGDYEALLLIRARSRLEYTNTINNLLNFPEITKVTTHIVLKSYKDYSTFSDITNKKYEHFITKTIMQNDENEKD